MDFDVINVCDRDMVSMVLFLYTYVSNWFSSRAPCLTSGLQGSVNVHRGALFLVPQ